MTLNYASITGGGIDREAVWFNGRREPLSKEVCQLHRAISHRFTENEFSLDLSELLTGFTFGSPCARFDVAECRLWFARSLYIPSNIRDVVIKNRSTGLGLSHASLLSREENLPPHLNAYPLDKMDLTRVECSAALSESWCIVFIDP